MENPYSRISIMDSKFTKENELLILTYLIVIKIHHSGNFNLERTPKSNCHPSSEPTPNSVHESFMVVRALVK